MTLAVAERFYRDQRRVSGRALAAASVLWGERAPRDFDAWFLQHSAELVALTVDAQTALVARGVDYVGAALAAQSATVTPDVEVRPDQLVGVAGDGRPLKSLMYGAVISARASLAKLPAEDRTQVAMTNRAWADAGRAAMVVRMQTAMADASRVATGLAAISRPGIGYTRMLVGSSCSRCVVLAGRTYRSSTPFSRHPGCDCRHVPGRDRDLQVHTVDAQAFFDSLTPGQQDRKFTKAGAQAIRDGADVNQVVNARRGAGLDFASGRITNAERDAIRAMRVRHGHRRLAVLPTTTEGTTRRGIAGSSMRAAGLGATEKRLMPEAIYQAATGRDDALDLLRTFGYVL